MNGHHERSQPRNRQLLTQRLVWDVPKVIDDVVRRRPTELAAAADAHQVVTVGRVVVSGLEK